jgi:competence protein ComEC
LYDVGFQLSFLATLGIVLFYTPLADKLKIKNDFLDWQSILLTTIVAQLGVLGILLYTFNSISLISLPANLLILPFLPIIMLGGIIFIFLSFFSSTLAMFFVWPTWLLLHWEISVIKLLANLSWAIKEFNNVSIWLVSGYYFILGMVLLIIYFNRFKK